MLGGPGTSGAVTIASNVCEPSLTVTTTACLPEPSRTTSACGAFERSAAGTPSGTAPPLHGGLAHVAATTSPLATKTLRACCPPPAGACTGGGCAARATPGAAQNAPKIRNCDNDVHRKKPTTGGVYPS